MISSKDAIKVLSEQSNTGKPTFDQDYKQAQLLGIQALSRHQNRYHMSYQALLEPLPGEALEVPNETR